MHVLIDMKSYQIVFADVDPIKVDEAKNLAAPPTFVTEVPGGWDGFSSVDLVRFYNKLPGVTAVNKFESKAKGIARINTELAKYEGIPPYAASAAQLNTQETTPVATKKPKQKRQQLNGETVTVSITAEGKKGTRKFQEGSARGKVFAALERAEGGALTLSELSKRCSHFANAGAVRGCVQKLAAIKLVKID